MSPNTLAERMGLLGAQPFAQAVVHSPWNAVVDAPSLHGKQKQLILELLKSCGQPDSSRCLTVQAPAGYGKTHLLAWTREQLDQRDDALFIYVPPYTAGGGPFEQHLLRATLEALRLRSHRKARLFADNLRRFLAESYDRVVASRDALVDLNTGSRLQRWLFPSSLQIGRRVSDEQLSALQRSFRRRGFLGRAFVDFKKHQPKGEDARLDWDTFAATCLLACGDVRQRWHADRWFQNEFMPPEVREPFHLDNPCQGQDKTCSVLYTLSRLVNQVFCFAFDQMEDTYISLRQRGKLREDLEEIALILRPLSAIPRFCLLFMFQTSIWSEFRQNAPQMIIHRMTADHGEQQLDPLDDATACELVRWRMENAVWKALAPERPPQDEPFYPFKESELRQLRLHANSELRDFLRCVRERYGEVLQGPAQPPRTIEVTGIEPDEILSHEPTPILIRGRNFPPDVEVYFGELQVSPVVCRPQQGEIDVTSPINLEGKIEVRVQATDDRLNAALTHVRYVPREVHRPYAKHLDRNLLKERREQLGWSQTKAAEKIGKYQVFISNLERGKIDPPDDVFVKLAVAYERPLADFVKKPS